MKYNTQNAKIKSITEKTLIVGIDVGLSLIHILSDKRKEVRRILFYWIPVPEPEELLNGSG